MPRKVELSGAEKRKRARDKKVAELLAALAALGWRPPVATSSTSSALPADQPAWVTEFQDAGAPDLDNPSSALVYVRRLQLVVLRQQVTTPRPSDDQVLVWKRVEAQVKAMGMTQIRVDLEDRVKRMEAIVEDASQVSAGVSRRVAGSSLKRPPTSRGGGRSRGPRSTDGDGNGPRDMP